MQRFRNAGLYRSRQFVNTLILTTSLGTTAFGLSWLGWLLWTLLGEGLRYLNLSIFYLATPPPGRTGGLGNAILGHGKFVLIFRALEVWAGTVPIYWEVETNGVQKGPLQDM